MDIIRNTSYQKYKLVRFRGEIGVSELGDALNELTDYVRTEGAKRVGSSMTAIHLLHLETKKVDIEIFLPLDKKILSKGDYEYLDRLELYNCITTHFKGGSYFLPNLYTEMYHRAKNMELELKMPFYNVFSKDPKEIFGVELVELFVYAVANDKIERI